MPNEKCMAKGKAGERWGKKGKCYTGKDAAKKAAKQGRAAYANGYRGGK